MIDRRPAAALLACFVTFATTVTAKAQIDPDPPPDEVIVAGVSITADGMIEARRIDGTKRLREIKQAAFRAKAEDNLIYISLPRLFAEVKANIDAGKPVPDDMRLLGGMTKLQYVFVYPDKSDLVIAGVGEPVIKDDPARPIGAVSGKPVLRLDDLVVALRTFGPGARVRSFGCSIDHPAGAGQRATDAFNQNRRASTTAKQQLLADAVGPQTVLFFGIQPDTRFAFTCLEADFRLKRLGLGIDKAPVSSLRHSVSSSGQGGFSRWWFVTDYQPMLVSKDGTAFEFKGQSLKIVTSGSLTDDQVEASPSAQRFADNCTKHYDTIATAFPSWAELANLADLSRLAVLIAEDKLHEKANWNLQWITQTGDCYAVPTIRVPKTARTYARKLGGGYAIGGVKLSPGASVSSNLRQTDSEGMLNKATDRPSDGEWVKTLPKQE